MTKIFYIRMYSETSLNVSDLKEYYTLNVKRNETNNLCTTQFGCVMNSKKSIKIQRSASV